MARFDAKSGNLYMTDLGRIASHFYISHASIATINEAFSARMSEADILQMMSTCAEFESLKVRDEEVADMESMLNTCCPLEIKDALSTREGKVQVLLQVGPPANAPDCARRGRHAECLPACLRFQTKDCAVRTGVSCAIPAPGLTKTAECRRTSAGAKWTRFPWWRT